MMESATVSPPGANGQQVTLLSSLTTLLFSLFSNLEINLNGRLSGHDLRCEEMKARMRYQDLRVEELIRRLAGHDTDLEAMRAQMKYQEKQIKELTRRLDESERARSPRRNGRTRQEVSQNGMGSFSACGSEASKGNGEKGHSDTGKQGSQFAWGFLQDQLETYRKEVAAFRTSISGRIESLSQRLTFVEGGFKLRVEKAVDCAGKPRGEVPVVEPTVKPVGQKDDTVHHVISRGMQEWRQGTTLLREAMGYERHRPAARVYQNKTEIPGLEKTKDMNKAEEERKQREEIPTYTYVSYPNNRTLHYPDNQIPTYPTNETASTVNNETASNANNPTPHYVYKTTPYYVYKETPYYVYKETPSTEKEEDTKTKYCYCKEKHAREPISSPSFERLTGNGAATRFTTRGYEVKPPGVPIISSHDRSRSLIR
ncbi:hypothetical protein CSUI_002540 [Cystoisospora suis]|uniref:Uncharacterized protein n=1 Tax=Cystoisospora suis TaxID=483139 RepID=A0A2C6KHU3_9APIC|nr:hypothetical protein CSUI_002540 [Cystoisospora suis]